MDSLAAGGVRFKKSYCTSPVCGPSRSSLITGRMPHETGVSVRCRTIHKSISNFGHIFREAGYETIWTGKWHLPRSYPRKALPGFDYLPVMSEHYHLGSMTDYAVADRAVKFLCKKHERPFILVVSLHNPHDICSWIPRPPVKHARISRFPPLPANFAIDQNEPKYIKDCRVRTNYGAVGRTKNWDNNQWRAYLWAYYKYVGKVDRLLGRIFKTLHRQNLEEDTLIIFTSDHGEGCAGHHWVTKLMLYEESVTVPMIVCWKGITPAGIVDRTHLVSGLDVLPTMCDYAGLEVPEGVRGISLRSLIENPSLGGHKFLVAELQAFKNQPKRKGRMVRTRQYKYVVFSDGENPEMLFDLEADPGETRNLAYRPAMRGKLIRYRNLLRKWIAETKDSFIQNS